MGYISKFFTAAAILRLEKEGELRLNEKIYGFMRIS